MGVPPETKNGRVSILALPEAGANILSDVYVWAIVEEKKRGHHSSRYHLYNATNEQRVYRRSSLPCIFALGVCRPQLRSAVDHSVFVRAVSPGWRIVVFFAFFFWTRVSMLFGVSARVSPTRLIPAATNFCRDNPFVAIISVVDLSASSVKRTRTTASLHLVATGASTPDLGRLTVSSRTTYR